ncbi:YciI family protein [uncultured Flavobacterium sp.]|uniref:YciI family protein n=1 Tax=uncultured Flavobacterium sp. TaxID=165435 RepID=UPI0025DEE014|nr:YciI family protein [uncultured Flavobacterium sp.]
MKTSKEFMLLFRFEPVEGYQPTESEQAEQHRQWGSFIGKLAIQEKLVSTYQLGFSGKLVNAQGTVTDGVYSTGGIVVGGNMVVKALSLDEATAISKECPILAMGGTVEVREIEPME